MQVNAKKSVLFFIFITNFLVFSSCSRYQKIRSKSLCTVPLFIAIPRNILVHHTITPQLYNAVRNHFSRSGYLLADNDFGNYTLTIKVATFDFPHKFISPDIVLHGYRLKIGLCCEIYDQIGELIAKRKIDSYTTIHSPEQPVLRPNFVSFGMQFLFERVAVKIDHWVQETLTVKKEKQ